MANLNQALLLNLLGLDSSGMIAVAGAFVAVVGTYIATSLGGQPVDFLRRERSALF